MVRAQQIKEHMEVCGSDGAHVGTVDCTKELNGGEHHIIPLEWVDKVDDKVRLKKPARDAMAKWQTAA